MNESTQPAGRTSIDVTVGGRSYVIGRFNGYKATRVMREAAAIGRRYPKIGRDLAKYKADYAEENTVELTRTEAEYQLARDLEAAKQRLPAEDPAIVAAIEALDQQLAAVRSISPDAWESAEGLLRFRRSPRIEDQVIAVFPDVVEHAQDRVVQLLAILALPNNEARDAWQEGGDDAVDERLKALANDLLFDGDAEELLNLALAGLEVGRAQFAPLRDRVGKLLAQLGLREDPPIPTVETKPSERTEKATADSSPLPSDSQTPPSSSTEPAPPITGDPQTSSSESPGSLSAAASNG